MTLTSASTLPAAGEGEGGASDRDVVVANFLVASARDRSTPRRGSSRARRAPIVSLRLSPGTPRETALLLPTGKSPESGIHRRSTSDAPTSCLFGARPCDAAHRRVSAWRPAWRGAADPVEPAHHHEMFATLASVAPSSRDKQVLKRMMVRDRAAGYPRPSKPRPEPTGAAPLVDDPLEAARHTSQLHGPLHRPSKGLERLLGRFAENLYQENNRRLSPIGLEAQLFRINARLAHPGHEDHVVETQRFLEAYLERRGRRALYNATIDTVRGTALVSETYQRAMAFRNRYLNFSASYGGYDRSSVRDDVETSVVELAEQNEQQFGVDETIEEELAVRRLGVMERVLNPFKKGRVSLRASMTDWVELIWKTPNFEFRAAPKKARLRLGGTISGLDVSSYAATRYRGWRGRSGLEIVRPIDERTRLKLAAGINFGRQDDEQSVDLADVFSLTNDPSYVYLSFERSF